MPLREIPGTHCDVCLTPAQQGFYTWQCRRYHGQEFVCCNCKIWIDTQIPRLIDYLVEFGGCAYEEVRLAEQRLNITVTPTPKIYG